MKTVTRVLLLCLVMVCVVVDESDARRKTNRVNLRQKETNALNFMRLAMMRLIYGVANRVGLGDEISDALGGAFVPPGVDDYYDYGGLLDRNDDYDDYDY